MCQCVLGGTPGRSNEEYWGGNIPWINSGEVNKFRILNPSEYISEKGLGNSATKMMPSKTTVVAITGATLGQYSLLEIPSCANQSVVGIIPNSRMPYEFIYPFIAHKMDDLLAHQTGGAQQHINKQNVESLAVEVPTKEQMATYIKTVSPLYTLIGQNEFEIKVLTELRESLLPKLMSGEIDVSEVEI